MRISRTAAIGMAVVVLVGGLFFGLHLTKDASHQPTPEAIAEDVQGIPVVLANVQSMVFKERARVTGNVRAVRTALVSARVPGIIDEIFVDEGDYVTAGVTQLFQTDSVKLQRAVEITEHQVDVSIAGVAARQATLARVEASIERIQLDLERYQRLQKQGAVTQSVLEIQETMLKQATAERDEVRAGLTLAQTQEMQAKSNMAISRKDLSDALVLAPISGKVSQRMREPGEMAGAGTPVLRVDDLTLVEISAFLPEINYARIIPNETMLGATIQGDTLEELPVTFKNPLIHTKLRAFEIKTRLQDPPDGVVPGAMADLAVVLQKRQGLGAPREAILQRRQGPVIFSVIDGHARMIPVQTGLEMDGWVEITGEGITQEMPVVRMGQEQLNDGAIVMIVSEGTN